MDICIFAKLSVGNFCDVSRFLENRSELFVLLPLQEYKMRVFWNVDLYIVEKNRLYGGFVYADSSLGGNGAIVQHWAG